MTDCIFCKIVAGEIPSKKVYEDEDVLAFHDINPAARVHFMIIPKRHVSSLDVCDGHTGIFSASFYCSRLNWLRSKVCPMVSKP